MIKDMNERDIKHLIGVIFKDDIITKNNSKFNQAVDKVFLSNEVIDGYIDFATHCDNIGRNGYSTTGFMLDIVRNCESITADKAHVDKLIAVLKDAKGSICNEFTGVINLLVDTCRPVEEWSRDQMIEFIKKHKK